MHGSLTHHNVASGAVLVLALGYTEWAQLSNSNQFTGIPLTLAAKHGSVDLVGERRALQSVRVQCVQYLEVLNDNHFHLLEAPAAARSSQQELCYDYATPKPSTLILSHTSVWPRASMTYQKANFN